MRAHRAQSIHANIPTPWIWMLRYWHNLIYGAGLYRFFNNYNTSCSAQTGEGLCQYRNIQIQGVGILACIL